ncbi:hypothetical protein HHUSO_G9084 [Huso huso]|uniref:Uncharacterized protein n=1 Tax=Huso huso TaxID=61971 RepID=A0ABR0ZSX2_HUSHU
MATEKRPQWRTNEEIALIEWFESARLVVNVSVQPSPESPSFFLESVLPTVSDSQLSLSPPLELSKSRQTKRSKTGKDNNVDDLLKAAMTYLSEGEMENM